MPDHNHHATSSDKHFLQEILAIFRRQSSDALRGFDSMQEIFFPTPTSRFSNPCVNAHVIVRKDHRDPVRKDRDGPRFPQGEKTNG